MIYSIKVFFRFASIYGLRAALVGSIIRMFSARDFKAYIQVLNTPVVPSPPSPEVTLCSAMDYFSWEQYGGGAADLKQSTDLACYIWFVPDWLNVWGGGHYTLFRFANHFAHKGTRNIIFIYNNQRHETPNALQNELDEALSDCELEVVVDPTKLPRCTGAIATTWQSAYYVLAFPFAEKKIYFMQDYESFFYSHGTMSVQANNTYTFGFIGVTGGHWLRKCYEMYGGSAHPYIFSTDRDIFYPISQNPVREKVKRLFFYGRPSTERRCFELGMDALRLISQSFPDVEIVIAGLDLVTAPPFKATLLGNMSLRATGELYRTCDVGIALSATNLSYLPVELMACGVPVITNKGDNVEWYCENRINSLVSDPTPQSILKAFTELRDDYDLRRTIVANGMKKAESTTWEIEIDKVFDHIQCNK